MQCIVEDVLESDLRHAEKGKDTGIRPPFVVEVFTSTEMIAGTYTIWTASQRKQLILDTSKRLFRATEDIECHAQNVDHAFSELVRCNFVLQEGQTTSGVAKTVCDILARLPPRPVALPDFTSDLRSDYFNISNGHISTNGLVPKSWDDLKVVVPFNKNIIRMVLVRAMYPTNELSDLINVTGELLEVCSSIGADCSSVLDCQRWFILRAFLWTSWQRSMMLLFHDRLKVRLRSGWTYGDPYDWLRPTFPAPKISTQDMSSQLSAVGKAQYMCTWAFELLRSEPLCVGMDFRLFHQRYSELFGGRSGRCSSSSVGSCDGKHPDHCQRYRGMEIKDQNAHDSTCIYQQCSRLTWNEASYRAVKGARAVSLSTRSSSGYLSYCEASASTLAISHVWSHGQGGRPEEGMNLCLHKRYCRLANILGCTSYWMDTPCIPQDHRLRKEAISQINGVFKSSCVTLVCDRDLMDVDTADMTTRLRESILVTIMVCDWNARAWTFLEAMKGRKSIHILCKNDSLVSLRELIWDVYDNGRLDLAILCLLTPHLLPWYVDKLDIPRSKFDREVIMSGEMPIEIAGTLLSYRPASRPGDDIVIWSLIFDGEKAFYSAEDFWTSRVGSAVATGFLLSSAERLNTEGLSWAPKTPYAAPTPKKGQLHEAFYRASDGMATEYGKIEVPGLFATWLVFEFIATRVNIEKEIAKARIRRFSTQARTWIELGKIRRRLLHGYRFGALLQARARAGVSYRPGQDAARYPGKFGGTLVAVCGSNDSNATVWERQPDSIPGNPFVIKSPFKLPPYDSYKWTWAGVYEWPKDVLLPTFTLDKGFWIA